MDTKPTVVIVATLDTKGPAAAYLRDTIAEAGAATLLIDPGILGEPGTAPDIDRSAVAEAAGTTLEALVATGDKGSCIAGQTRGLCNLVERLYAEGRLQGIVGLGGGQGTSIVTTAMRALPVGRPETDALDRRQRDLPLWVLRRHQGHLHDALGDRHPGCQRHQPADPVERRQRHRRDGAARRGPDPVEERPAVAHHAAWANNAVRAADQAPAGAVGVPDRAVPRQRRRWPRHGGAGRAGSVSRRHRSQRARDHRRHFRRDRGSRRAAGGAGAAR